MVRDNKLLCLGILAKFLFCVSSRSIKMEKRTRQEPMGSWTRPISSHLDRTSLINKYVWMEWQMYENAQGKFEKFFEPQECLNYPPQGTLQVCWIWGPKFNAFEKLVFLGVCQLTSSSAPVSSRAACGLYPLQCSTTSCSRLALKTSLESFKLSPSIIFTIEPLSFKERWRLRWKDVKLLDSHSLYHYYYYYYYYYIIISITSIIIIFYFKKQ